jgi:hypothetical protein
MTTPEPDYKRLDSPTDPKYSDSKKYNPKLDGIANKQNYVFNYGLNPSGLDHYTYYTNKDCYTSSDLNETEILMSILDISKKEADEDFKKQINDIIEADTPVVATEKLKNVKYDITSALDKNLKEYYGYNILSVCEETVKNGVNAATDNYKSAVSYKSSLAGKKTNLEKQNTDIMNTIVLIKDEINKTMDKRKNILINGNSRASNLIKSNFDIKNTTAYSYDLSEKEYDALLKKRVAELVASILLISKQINEDIAYNKEILNTREADVALLHTTNKQKISDLNKSRYIEKYNTVKIENDKFKKTWDGIVNMDFMNDLKGKYNKKNTTYIEFINKCLFYAYYMVVVGFAYYLFVYSISSVVFSVACIVFFILFPFFIHSIEIIVYNTMAFLMALTYGRVYSDNANDRMDEFKTPMVYSGLKPIQPA